MKFVTPIVLFVIMTWWFINDAIPVFLLSNTASENVLYIWGARILMLALLAGIMLMVKKAWTNRQEKVIS
jgi:hypothetical protein